MKFRARYTRTLILEEEFEAPSTDDAEELVWERREILSHTDYPDILNASTLLPAGRFSLHPVDGQPPQLYIDDERISSGQILLVVHGGGEPRPGRAIYRAHRGWELLCEEFLGHTYLNIPLNEEWFKHLTAMIAEQ